MGVLSVTVKVRRERKAVQWGEEWMKNKRSGPVRKDIFNIMTKGERQGIRVEPWEASWPRNKKAVI